MCVWIQFTQLRRLYIVICKNSICKINARGGEEEATAHLSVIKLPFITRTESMMETQLTLSITVSDRHTPPLPSPPPLYCSRVPTGSLTKCTLSVQRRQPAVC